VRSTREEAGGKETLWTSSTTALIWRSVTGPIGHIGDDTITALAAELLDHPAALTSITANYTGRRGEADGPARPRIEALVATKRVPYVATVREALLKPPEPSRRTSAS
jgi:hypothetical protein